VHSCAVRNQVDRRGLTLVELLMSMAISSILIVALGGIVTATQTAWKHTQGIEDSQAQITAAFDRMKMMVSQAGIYQISGQPPQVGLAVVTHTWNSIDIPDTLVVWTGGRNGGISDLGTLTRLPTINELLIYTIDPNDSHNFVEIALPAVNASIDFNSSSFKNTIRSAITSSSAESALLSNRVKSSQYMLSGRPWGAAIGNIRFDLVKSPSDTSLSGVAPGTSAWMSLPWPQGTASASSGLRQATVNYEVQFEVTERTSLNDVNSPTALPFFGSSSRLYAYTP
ncbi:MAG: prepilin-type N-terminal cleavage/methylation domain-containing protein, partial [Planctomycetota bacterium]